MRLFIHKIVECNRSIIRKQMAEVNLSLNEKRCAHHLETCGLNFNSTYPLKPEHIMLTILLGGRKKLGGSIYFHEQYF